MKESVFKIFRSISRYFSK